MSKAVYLEWDDSSAMAGRVWQDREHVVEHVVCRCTTIGFIIRENKDFITVAGSVQGENDISGDMTIPKSAIRKRRVVRWK